MPGQPNNINKEFKLVMDEPTTLLCLLGEFCQALYDEMRHSLQENNKSMQEEKNIDKDFMKEMFARMKQLIDKTFLKEMLSPHIHLSTTLTRP